jgi:hypothetical protein
VEKSKRRSPRDLLRSTVPAGLQSRTPGEAATSVSAAEVLYRCVPRSVSGGESTSCVSGVVASGCVRSSRVAFEKQVISPKSTLARVFDISRRAARAKTFQRMAGRLAGTDGRGVCVEASGELRLLRSVALH